VAGLFPPQAHAWGLPLEAPLSPRAASRLAREAACHSFDNAARALNIDWGTTLDGKQIQRWGEALGRTLVAARQKELERFEKGSHLPPSKENQHQLLVIGMDGGRVQSREKDEKTGSRCWMAFTRSLGDIEIPARASLDSINVSSAGGRAFPRIYSIAS